MADEQSRGELNCAELRKRHEVTVQRYTRVNRANQKLGETVDELTRERDEARARCDALAEALQKVLNSAPVLDEQDRAIHKEGYAALVAWREKNDV